MISDEKNQLQINQLSESIRFYRSRRPRHSDLNYEDRQIRRETEELVRQKVIRQLHDGLSQTVSALAMRVNFARRMMDADAQAAQEELEKVEDLARDTTKEIRHLIFILHPIPPGSFELTKSIELLAEKMQELFDLQIELMVSDRLVDQLPMPDQRIIYALVEEAIDSARKRNGCTHLVVSLDKFERQVALLEIKDGGDFSKQMDYPFQISELESIQEFGELISGSIRVLDKGKIIQILFPFSEKAMA